MSDKVLTVIVPSYNMEKYLPKCLGSLEVSPELMARLEVLVVNDGSKDRTSEIAHGFADKWPETFKVIDKENGNYGSCINAALPRTTGVYVKVVDADDYVRTDGFARLLTALAEEVRKESSGADLVVTEFDEVGPSGRVLRHVDFGLKGREMRTLDDKPEGSDRFCIQGICYRTALLREMGYRQSEGLSYTDTEWIVEPMSRVSSVRYLPWVVSCYLFGREGQTMEVKTFARCFSQLMQIAEGLVSRYRDRMSRATDTSRKYYHDQIIGVLHTIYVICTLGCGGLKAEGDLAAFDEFLKSVPELYKELDLACYPSNRFPFHYVREWRRHRSALTWRFFCYRQYMAFCRVMVRLHLV